MPTRKLITLCWLQILCLTEIYSLGLEEGDFCILKSNIQGYCMNLNKCDYAYTLLVFQVKPELCGFDGLTPIVCCTDLSLSRGNSGSDNDNPKPLGFIPSIRAYTNNGTEVLRIPSSLYVNQFSVGGQKCIEFYPETNRSNLMYSYKKNVPSEHFKHMAKIGYGDITNPHWLCSGSLISQKFILTSAHCLNLQNFGEPTIIKVGEIQSKPGNINGIQAVPVRRVHPHPEYKATEKANDIGLIEVEYEFIQSENVSPACLDTAGIIQNQSLTVTSWSKTSSSDESTKLLDEEKSVMQFDDCQKLYSNFNNTLQICAVTTTNKVSNNNCQENSGAPLQSLKSVYSGDPIPKVHIIIGIASYGEQCGISNSPEIYTRVYPYLHWIQKIVWPNFMLKTVLI